MQRPKHNSKFQNLFKGMMAILAILLVTPAVQAESLNKTTNAAFSPVPLSMLVQGSVANCPYNAKDYRGTNQSVTCRCSSGATNSGSVWGTGTYTDDSRVCRAARHAGVIGSRGGVVTFRVSPGLDRYQASNRNGVSSGSWNSWHGSYRFVGASSAGGGGGTTQASSCPTNATSYRGSGRSVTCRCSGGATGSGSVWGSGTYTDDSRICRAAVHAGVIGRNGGTVTFRMVGGRDSYTGSSANGVSTSRYGRWTGSYIFVGARSGGATGGNSGSGQSNVASCPTNATSYRGSGRTVTCGCSSGSTGSGSVWGSGTYTDDSRICRAAVHAGVIGRNGGTVTIRMVGARSSYSGSSSNGVSTSRYGRWHGSYIFVR